MSQIVNELNNCVNSEESTLMNMKIKVDNKKCKPNFYLE